MTYLIIDMDNEIVTTETGERDWPTQEAAKTYVESLGDWKAPLKIVTAEEWYAA